LEEDASRRMTGVIDRGRAFMTAYVAPFIQLILFEETLCISCRPI